MNTARSVSLMFTQRLRRFQMTNKISETLNGLKVRSKWSKPKPFTEDKQIYYISGKKQAEQQLKQYFKAEMLRLLPEKLGTNKEFLRSKTQCARNESYNQGVLDIKQAIEKWEG